MTPQASGPSTPQTESPGATQAVGSPQDRVRRALRGASERALLGEIVRRFVQAHGGVAASSAIQSFLQHADSDAMESLGDGGFTTLNEIVLGFEALQSADAKERGSVYTPQEIADFMVKQTIHSGNEQVLDPACGVGAFLVAALLRIVSLTGKSGVVASWQLTGFDIDKESLRRCGVLLDLALLSLGENTEHRGRLEERDATKVLSGEVLVDRQFEAVVMNPPYVRYQDLSEDTREFLKTHSQACSKGNFNLYFAFFEIAQAFAAENGRVAVIAPNGWMSSSSGKGVRELLSSRRWASSILDFGHARVFEAMTYTAVVLSGKTDDLSYTRVGSANELGSWKRDKGVLVKYEGLGSKPWGLVAGQDLAWVERVNRSGMPLSEVAQIRYGVATLRDNLYLVRRDTEGRLVKDYGESLFYIEEVACKRVLKVPELTSQQALDESDLWIIYPYVVHEGKAGVWTEEELVKYPETKRYLLTIRDELVKRDHGKKEYTSWFAYGRTQGLIPTGNKLVSPLYASTPRFLLEEQESLLINGVAITSEVWDLEALSRILNSRVTERFMKATSTAITGGFFAYQKSQLGRFVVPELEDSEQQIILEMSDAEFESWLTKVYEK